MNKFVNYKHHKSELSPSFVQYVMISLSFSMITRAWTRAWLALVRIKPVSLVVNIKPEMKYKLTTRMMCSQRMEVYFLMNFLLSYAQQSYIWCNTNKLLLFH